MKVVLAIVISVTLATPLAAQDVTASNQAAQPPANNEPKKNAAPEQRTQDGRRC